MMDEIHKLSMKMDSDGWMSPMWMKYHPLDDIYNRCSWMKFI
jgi:hypothetical protein